MIKIQNAVNKRFKRSLDVLKITHNSVAVYAGCHESMISRVVNEKSEVQIEMMQYLYEKHNINMNWLLCGKGDFKIDDAFFMVEEPQAEYENLSYKDKYLTILEENRVLSEKLIWYMENCDCPPKKESKVASGA